MLKKTIIATLSLASLTTVFPVYADEDMSCKVEVAVSAPPVRSDQYVAFNVTSEFGFSKSITLHGVSAPQFINHLPCSQALLNISATLYSIPTDMLSSAPVIGQCTLKAGPITLNAPENSVSVVFPYDFNCNY